MKTLLKMTLCSISSTHAGLPYNINWRRPLLKSTRDFLNHTPIKLIDIGARFGCPGELEKIHRYIDYIAFEADPQEAKRLSEIHQKGLKSQKILPYFVGKKQEEIIFNLYKNRGESSRLSPDMYYQKAFSPSFQVDTSIPLKSNSLAWIAKREDLLPPDFLKLDTQGTELDILEGAGNWIGQIPLIETEVEFLPLYQDQPLFHDVGHFMHQHGYVLLYLNRVFTSRAHYPGKSRGQIVFGDALYGLGLEQIKPLDTVKKAKYVILLIQYGHLDFAFEIVNTYPEIRTILTKIDLYFKPSRPIFSWITRFFWMQVDKGIAWLLWIRKTNQLRSDSDRSWPVR